MSKLPDSCCGCCSLRVGVIVIACIEIIFRILLIISSVLSLSLAEHDEYNNNNEAGFLPIFMSVVNIVMLVPSIILLFGGIYNKKWLVLPWLVAICILLVIMAFLLIIVPASFAPKLRAALNFKEHEEDYKVIAAIVFVDIFLLMTISICIYFFLVVLSFFIELKNPQEDEQQV